MDRGHRTRTRNRAAELKDETFVGRGLHATVWQTGDGSVVRKEYILSNGLTSHVQANHELVTLQRASRMLERIPGARVPRPHYVEQTSGQLVMEFCAGTPLYLALGNERFNNDNEVEDLARTYAQIIVALSNELSLEEVDISVRNTLVDFDRGELVLIDFTRRALSVPLPTGVRRIEYILGSFVAGALSTSLHRSTVLTVRASWRLRALARVLVSELASDGHITREHVRDMAWKFYWHRSRNGGRLRKIWFSSLAAVAYWVLLRNTVELLTKRPRV